jgi:hypothetical protein
MTAGRRAGREHAAKLLATVDLALAELVRRARAGEILELAGSGLWPGDLAELRADAPTRRRRTSPADQRRRRSQRAAP